MFVELKKKKKKCYYVSDNHAIVRIYLNYR